MGQYVCPLESLRAKDVAIAGGKNASLGEMIAELKPKGVNIPGGFAVTAEAYRHFIRENGFEKKIEDILKTYSPEPKKLRKCGKAIRKLIQSGKFPKELKHEITEAYTVFVERTPNGAKWMSLSAAALQPRIFPTQALQGNKKLSSTSVAIGIYSVLAGNVLRHFLQIERLLTVKKRGLITLKSLFR